ncbi:CrcB family protein [Bifidobacterium sp. MA2]|uniref:Fluoride-specific ion channel FluC n=1 Tax=Bifidobacterium santillanense TaxID=2809028 RepID=A0ABS5UMB8_9BIFI|nr:CrcB family protein [Bifidobacterium santillanense]MBT1172036.1 CrcB family protein [Bifidobacterium santillanense]
MSQSSSTSTLHRFPAIHPDIFLVVFVGGSIGTALRYAFALIPASGDFHTGTLIANLIACFCYAGLTTFLSGSASTRFGVALGARGREYASRGLGMGLCGGLSTMSTLALECFTAIHSGDASVGILYLLATFALGILCAVLGTNVGSRLAVTVVGRANGSGDVADITREEA